MADFGSLRDYRDLKFAGKPQALATLGDKLATELPKERWERQKDKEKDWPPKIVGGVGFVFARKADEALPAASVYVITKGGTGSISNIVPDNQGKLDFDEYNGILEDFLEQGLRPLTQTLGLTIDATPAERHLTDWLSEAAVKKLRLFSAAANKSSGASHPSDYERWVDFLVQAHQDGGSLEAGMLRRWLLEIEHWPEEYAGDLASQYSLSQDVLKRFCASAGKARKP